MELAVALLEAALNGARSNLDAKLTILTDRAHVTSIAEQIAGLSHDAAAAAEGARSSMKPPPT
jgi:formiminotetrahydrofolate cyclodeaminase